MFYQICFGIGLSDPLEGLGDLLEMLIHHELEGVLVFVYGFESLHHVPFIEIDNPLQVVDALWYSANLFNLTSIYSSRMLKHGEDRGQGWGHKF